VGNPEFKLQWHTHTKKINDLKDNSNKQMNEVRKSIQDLDKKVNNMGEIP
jgi:uncharacterized protein YukE